LDKDYFIKSFSHQQPTSEQLKRIEHLRLSYKLLLDEIYNTCKDSRELRLALTNLENSLMYAVKSIVLENR
jgi:hypothetical protein